VKLGLPRWTHQEIAAYYTHLASIATTTADREEHEYTARLYTNSTAYPNWPHPVGDIKRPGDKYHPHKWPTKRGAL
jgi:hypothetical protein